MGHLHDNKKMKILERSRIKKILIRTPNWVGDAVMSTPFIKAVRKNFSNADISLLSKPWVSSVYENNPHIDQIITYDDSGRHKGLYGKARLARDVGKESFDLSLLLQNAFEAALITWMAAIPMRLGYDTDGRRILLTHPVHRYESFKKLHQIDYYLEMLKRAGLSSVDADMEIFISGNEKNKAIGFLRNNGCSEKSCIIGITPGAAFGTAKRWFSDRFAQVCYKLKNNMKAFFLIFGSPDEKELGERISFSIGSQCINLCGKTTLREAISLIDCCNFFLTNDSGLMHVAAALHIPQIAIFGPTDHTTTSPRNSFSHILRIPVQCSPCMKQDCPTDHRCMDLISVDHVYDMANKILMERGFS